MSQMQIRNPNELPVVDYREVKALQGDLKDPRSHDRLLAVLEKRGFDIPLFIWFDKSKGAWLLDGHQRIEVMIENDLNDQGSYEVPYIRIEAKTKKEAMARLLEITSKYGTVTVEGLEKYLQAAELPVAETMELISFPELDGVGAGDGSDSEEEDEGESDDDTAPEADTKTPPKSKLGEIYRMGGTVKCSHCNYENKL